MAAQVVKALPERDEWLYELKLDGYRALIVKDGTAPDIVEAVRAAGLEGIVAKRRDSPYQPGARASDWMKLKLERSQEFAVRCPFANLPDAAAGRWGGGVTVEQMTEMQWLDPELIAQVRFTEWTAQGRLRHAAFIALRSDKAPIQVVREP